MKLDEAEREIFDKIAQKYIDRIGIENLELVYAMHREYCNQLCLKHFPIKEFSNHLLYLELKSDKYNGISLNQIAIIFKERIGISCRSFYDFYHNYYIPRIKQENKRRNP